MSIDVSPLDKLISRDHLPECRFSNEVVLTPVFFTWPRLPRGVGNGMPQSWKVRCELFTERGFPCP